ncbi:MAG: YCF48-related protein, partial [candidate division WOR-3 bacterium]
MYRFFALLSIIIIISGCGLRKAQIFPQEKPVKAEVVRTAEWKVDFKDVFFTDINNGWIIGDNGTIINTTNGGKTWENQNSGTTANLNRIQFINNKEGWIVGDKGTLLQTIDGRNWRLQTLTQGNLVDLHFPDKYNGWIVGEAGAIYYTSDAGKTWKFISSGLGEA